MEQESNFYIKKVKAMRKIKFRCKKLKTGEWVYGENIQCQIDGTNRVCIEEHGYQRWLDQETVGQFTGLLDRNGKEIYEGDIVECVSWNEYFSKGGRPMEQFRRKMYVDFRNGGFKMVETMPYPMKDNEWDIIFNGDIEVIGNIHDNPELMEGGEK